MCYIVFVVVDYIIILETLHIKYKLILFIGHSFMKKERNVLFSSFHFLNLCIEDMYVHVVCIWVM